MKNVTHDGDTVGETKFDALPERMQEALGDLAGAAKEGLRSAWASGSVCWAS